MSVIWTYTQHQHLLSKKKKTNILCPNSVQDNGCLNDHLDKCGTPNLCNLKQFTQNNTLSKSLSMIRRKQNSQSKLKTTFETKIEQRESVYKPFNAVMLWRFLASNCDQRNDFYCVCGESFIGGGRGKTGRGQLQRRWQTNQCRIWFWFFFQGKRKR